MLLVLEDLGGSLSAQRGNSSYRAVTMEASISHVRFGGVCNAATVIISQRHARVRLLGQYLKINTFQKELIRH